MDDRIQALDAEAGRWPARVRALATPQFYRHENPVARLALQNAAVALVKEVKALRARIEETFSPMQAAAYRSWQEVLRQRHKIEDPLEDAEREAKRLYGAYEAHEESVRAEEQKYLSEVARKAEEDARLAEALVLEASGDGALADAVLRAKSIAPAPVAPRAVPKAEGTSTRTRWVGLVTDFMQLVLAVGGGKAPPAFLKPDFSAINAYVRGMRGATSIPGLRAVEERDVAVRA